jgi:Type IV secretion-system coupling protein DNA-binding domain
MEVLLVIVLLVLLVVARPPRVPFWWPLRGAPDPLTPDQANAVTGETADRLREAGRTADALPVRLGPITTPLDTFSKATVLIGVQGCGKSSLVNMLTPDLFELFHLLHGRTRFAFLDVKHELYPRLCALVPAHVPVYQLDPLDARAVVLDYPSVFPTRGEIDQLAHALCPPVAGDQTPFFRNAARMAIALVGYRFLAGQPRASRPWGLLDLCRVLADKRTVRRVLFGDYEGRSFYRATLGPNIKSSGDVFSTIRSVIQPLVVAALAEADEPPRLDLKRFMKEDGVAVLGIPPRASQAVLPVFNVFVRRLVEEALASAHPDDRLFLVLDEIAMLDRGVVEAVVNATCVGRSAGVNVIAATQSVELLEARFAKDQAAAFLASCATVVGFRCASHKSAEYVVGRMGSQEGLIYLRSWSSGPNGGGSGVSEQFQVRPTVLADELLHLPLADPLADELHFVATSPAFGNARATGPFVAATTVATDPAVPKYLPRPSGARSLRPLTPAEFHALGLSRRARPTS